MRAQVMKQGGRYLLTTMSGYRYLFWVAGTFCSMVCSHVALHHEVVGTAIALIVMAALGNLAMILALWTKGADMENVPGGPHYLWRLSIQTYGLVKMAAVYRLLQLSLVAYVLSLIVATSG